MNRFAYRTTGLAIKTISKLSRAQIRIHGAENIPRGAIIFVINHFTRIETLFMPYHIFRLTGVPVWSLADVNLFKGTFGSWLESVGGVSTKDPDRDRLIIKTLLTGEALWSIFPEGRMVKSKKIFDRGRFIVSSPEGRHKPHTGAATLAIRTEFYRRRLKYLLNADGAEAKRLMTKFNIESADPVLEKETFIVPANVTYFPLRARENALNQLAGLVAEKIPERLEEEIMTEGSMLLSGVDIDIRFARAIPISDYLGHHIIERDITAARRIEFDDPIPSLMRLRKQVLRLTQRYMAAIYRLTTVNHDHLLAATLKQLPRKKIDPEDFRRRVYWVAAQAHTRQELHRHRNLTGDQIHLLTTDRYGVYEDFIKVALEKEVLVRSADGSLTKTARMGLPFDFHKVRIDNPISVMANEVEPLRALQRLVARTAWWPRFFLKRKIVGHLLKQAQTEFAQDYARHAIKGESHPTDIGRPFLLRGRSRQLGVVLIHGYMAAPAEVKELAQFLAQRGMWVFAPRLKGHGTSPEDLARSTKEDWVKSVERGYAIIRNICRQVVVGGFSTGAGLALELSSRVEGLKAVFAIAPPLRLQDLSAKFVPAVDIWNRLMTMVRWDEAKKEFVENLPENPHINYHRNPISGVREIERLMESVEPRLGLIRVPVLVGQANGDPVVNPAGSKRIFDQLLTEDKRYVLFNFDRHGILLGEGAQRVHRLIADFILGL